MGNSRKLVVLFILLLSQGLGVANAQSSNIRLEFEPNATQEIIYNRGVQILSSGSENSTFQILAPKPSKNGPFEIHFSVYNKSNRSINISPTNLSIAGLQIHTYQYLAEKQRKSENFDRALAAIEVIGNSLNRSRNGQTTGTYNYSGYSNIDNNFYSGVGSFSFYNENKARQVTDAQNAAVADRLRGEIAEGRQALERNFRTTTVSPGASISGMITFALPREMRRALKRADRARRVQITMRVGSEIHSISGVLGRIGTSPPPMQIVTSQPSETTPYIASSPASRDQFASPQQVRQWNELGVKYNFGRGVPQNFGEAARLYKLAADAGLKEAQYNLGVLYHRGDGVELDYADAGLKEAQGELGSLYYNGQGVAKNIYEAFRLRKRAADQGYIPAAVALGGQYLEGGLYGVAQSTEKALELFQLGANEGNAIGQLALGGMYHHGRGVTQNFTEAARLYKLAADAGLKEAQGELGLLYYHGQGVAKNINEAARLFRLAADQGEAKAQINLGAMYYSGEGVEQNHAEAARLFRLASEQGEAKAHNYLAILYQNGLGVVKNEEEAARLFKLAADAGRADAQLELAKIYEAGAGIEKDHDQAIYWYMRAAEKGEAEAQYNLALKYEYGEGVPENVSEAIYWYNLAAAQGHSDAMARSAQLR
jgi:TPR repeat protein